MYFALQMQMWLLKKYLREKPWGSGLMPVLTTKVISGGFGGAFYSTGVNLLLCPKALEMVMINLLSHTMTYYNKMGFAIEGFNSSVALRNQTSFVIPLSIKQVVWPFRASQKHFHAGKKIKLWGKNDSHCGHFPW